MACPGACSEEKVGLGLPDVSEASATDMRPILASRVERTVGGEFESVQTSGGAGLLKSVTLVSIVFEI